MDDERTTIDSSIYHIDKLTETNYRSWAQQLRWILDEKELWELVEGTERNPEPSAARFRLQLRHRQLDKSAYNPPK